MNEEERIETVESLMDLLDCSTLSTREYDFINSLADTNIHTMPQLEKIKEIADEHLH